MAVSPLPQNAPRSLEPCAPQGGGHESHGPSPHHLGGCRQGQIGARVRQDHASGSHTATGKVRVDQATARLTRAQKLKAELEEKLLEVEQAVQDNLDHGYCRRHGRAGKRKARSHPKRPNHRPWLSLYHLQQGAVCRTPRVFACHTANPTNGCRCYHERRHPPPPGNRPAHGTGPAGRGRQSGISVVQSGFTGLQGSNVTPT